MKCHYRSMRYVLDRLWYRKKKLLFLQTNSRKIMSYAYIL